MGSAVQDGLVHSVFSLGSFCCRGRQTLVGCRDRGGGEMPWAALSKMVSSAVSSVSSATAAVAAKPQ